MGRHSVQVVCTSICKEGTKEEKKERLTKLWIVYVKRKRRKWKE